MDLENILHQLKIEIIKENNLAYEREYKALEFVDRRFDRNSKLSYVYENEKLKIFIHKLQLTKFPNFLMKNEEYFNFFTTHLESLDLFSNKISNIPDWMNQFKKLSFLSLIGNNLKKFNFPNIQSLKLLVLTNNNLETINIDLDNFPKLICLELSDNKIKQLEFIGSDENSLGMLRIDLNNIKKLSKSFEILKNLKYLTLQFNPLKKIDIDFSKLKNLKQLEIDKNQENILNQQQKDDLIGKNCQIKIS